MNMLVKLFIVFGLISFVCGDIQQAEHLYGNSALSVQQEQYNILKQMYVISKLINKNNHIPDKQYVSNTSNISKGECQVRQKFLQEENQKLRKQLEEVKQDYRKMMAKYDNDSSWPLFIFLTIAMFVLYHVFGIESTIAKATVRDQLIQNKDLQQCQFTKNSVIKKTTGDWIKVIVDASISNKKQYKFKIIKRQSWPINIGIVKTNNKKNQEQPQRIMYGNDCIFYKNSLLKLREGIGFQVGQTVKITVIPEENIITWGVQGQERYTYFSQSLNLKEGQWRYAIQMRGNTDEVELIE